MWKVFSSFGSDFDWRNIVLMPSEDRLEGKAFGSSHSWREAGTRVSHWAMRLLELCYGKGIRLYVFPWTVPTFGTFALWIVSPDPTTVSRGYIVKCKRATIYQFRRNTTGLTTSCLLLRKYQELPLSFLWKNWVSLTTYVCIWTMRCARPVGIMAPHWRLLSMPLSLWAGLFLKTSPTQYAPVW